MKKIAPFLLFPPLLIGILFFSFSQYRNKGNVSEVDNTIQNGNRITPNVTTTSSPSPSTVASVQRVDEINLTISSPESGITVDTNTVTVSGSTEPSASVAINDGEVTASKDGSFKTSVSLDEGENYISVVAYNNQGNVAERELLVTRTVSGL